MLEGGLERALFEEISPVEYNKTMNHLSEIGVIDDYNRELEGLRKEKTKTHTWKI